MTKPNPTEGLSKFASSHPIQKADAQRHAASAAVEILRDRLGPDYERFVDLFEIASFRFRPALMQPASAPALFSACKNREPNP